MMRRFPLFALLAVIGGLLLSACGSQPEAGLTEGDQAPAFTLPDAAGGDVSLSDFEGQPVLLYFHMARG